MRIPVIFAFGVLAFAAGAAQAQRSNGPLPKAFEACSESTVDTPCSFETRRGTVTGTCRQMTGRGMFCQRANPGGKRSQQGAQQRRKIDQNAILVTLLGTGGGPGGGGANMVTERMNANTLVEAGGQAFLFDAGRGAMLRLAQLGSTTIPRIDKIFLTHLHSDHIVDLSDLFLNGAGRNQRPVLNVYGPAGTAAMTGHLAKAYDWDLNYRANPKNPKLKMVGKDVDEGVVYDNGSVRVTAFRVDHWPPRKTESDREAFPALGYRLEYNGRSVVISGDTRYSRNTIKYAKGADLLIHEVHAGLDEKIVDGALTNGNGRPQAGSHHTGPKAAGTIFTRAAPKMALYTHIVWGRKSEQELIALTRETYAGPLTVGKEMMQVRVADTVEIVGSNSTGQRRTGTNP